ncbi:MAG: hypothetical protein F6K32_15370 [Desertifilum sp. SIO1I2]|nr:hypothetical protein [Desertifilum sp. SIO1I2]
MSKPNSSSSPELDPGFQTQVQRLHELIVWCRWLVVGGLWLSIGLLSLWELRAEIALLRAGFTWAAVRYGLYDHPLPALGLSLCVGMTTAVLVWQSRNILQGRSPHYQRQLERSVCRIRQQGSTHPLWKWICNS